MGWREEWGYVWGQGGQGRIRWAGSGWGVHRGRVTEGGLRLRRGRALRVGPEKMVRKVQLKDMILVIVISTAPMRHFVVSVYFGLCVWEPSSYRNL